MRVLLGNTNPRLIDTGDAGVDSTPRVTTIDVPETYTYEVAKKGAAMDLGGDDTVKVESAADLAVHVMRQVFAGGGVTHLPGQEAVLAVMAAWNAEASGPPSWVACDNPEFQVLLGAVFGCPTGAPADLEATHHTAAGPPGVGVVTPDNEQEAR